MNWTIWEKYKKYIYGVMTCLIVFLIMKYILPLVMPFFVALCIVAVTNPFLEKLERRFRISKSLAAGVLLILLASLLCIGIWYLCNAMCAKAGYLAEHMREYENNFCCLVHNACCSLEARMGVKPDAVEQIMRRQAEDLTRVMRSQALPKFMNHSIGYAKGCLHAIAYIGITFLAILFLAKDYKKIKMNLEGYEWFQEIVAIGKMIEKLVWHYFKAQGLILLVISIICVGGLWLAGISGFFFWGILAGVLDAFPFIGTGFVLVPTAIWLLLQGNVWYCVGVFLLYGICILVREFLEPKLIGKRMNLYPIVVLLSIYLGIRLYGLLGVITGPFSFLIIREITKRLK